MKDQKQRVVQTRGFDNEIKKAGNRKNNSITFGDISRLFILLFRYKKRRFSMNKTSVIHIQKTFQKEHSAQKQQLQLL